MNCLNVAVWESVRLHQCGEQEACQRIAQQLNTSLTLRGESPPNIHLFLFLESRHVRQLMKYDKEY